LIAVRSLTASSSDDKENSQLISRLDIPAHELSAAHVEITAYKYFGSWITDSEKKDQKTWKDTVRLNIRENQTILKLPSPKSRLSDALAKLLTLNDERAYFENILWKDSQVSLIAFRVVSPQTQTAIFEIDTDKKLALYVNSNFAKELSPDENAEFGMNLLVPIPLKEGENMFFIKLLSNAGPPTIRMLLTIDQSKDFQAAWSKSSGFLTKSIYPRGGSMDTPTIEWDNLLKRLTVSAEICNMLTGKVVMKKEKLRSGNVIRDRQNHLGEGFYKICYKVNNDNAEEYFIVGSSRRVFSNIKNLLSKIAWDDGTELNIEAQLKRGDILLSKANYNTGDRDWRDKLVFTLASLSDFIKYRGKEVAYSSKDKSGLHIRGFISAIDKSKQFYRLYVPSTYSREQGIPLLLIMPTAITAREKPFIESPFMASHRDAGMVCKYAEKYGFAVLWTGYRNAPEGWTYESIHANEALNAVENDYNIDISRISVYGVCSGGLYAGRLIEKYPKRFSSIVYDRAIFEPKIAEIKGMSDSLIAWNTTISPSEKIIKNSTLKIFVLNDGSTIRGHGEIQLSEEFLQTAQTIRNDVKYMLGKRPIGLELWEVIFKWLLSCRNESPDKKSSNILSEFGYHGPISEVFSRPFVVVEGTSSGPGGSIHIRPTIHVLSQMYTEQFYGAKFITKKDIDITEDDLRNKSLILIGNSKSNSIWSKMETQLSLQTDKCRIVFNEPQFSGDSAFMAVYKNPINEENYILFVGAIDLRNLLFATNINPFRAWFDACVIENNKYRLEHKIIHKLVDVATQYNN
jgi:hypothetical protein